MTRGGEPWGHSITELSEALPGDITPPSDLIETASRLDKHYIPSRYPNGFASGYPGKLYTRGEAEAAIRDAEKILDYCRRRRSSRVYRHRARTPICSWCSRKAITPNRVTASPRYGGRSCPCRVPLICSS
jgi:hypothetical protein